MLLRVGLFLAIAVLVLGLVAATTLGAFGLFLADSATVPGHPYPSASVGAAAQIFAAVATLAVAVLTLAYVLATKRMVDEMHRARVSASVVAVADRRVERVGLRVENFGPAPAKSVSVTFIDPLGPTKGSNTRVRKWQAGDKIEIASLAPGQMVWTAIAQISQALPPVDLTSARVRCEWADGDGSQSQEFSIDCRALLDAME